MAYPRTLSEDATLRKVLEGQSLSRFGDGEYKLAAGSSAKSQRADKTLMKRLRAILRDHQDGVIVGIPNICSESPKFPFWSKYQRFTAMLNKSRIYGSSFVTRPDSAPWINRPDYWDSVQSLWRDKDVTLVRGSGKSLTGDRLPGARTVTEILGPRQHAWSEYDALMERIGTPKVALLCLGASATVMACDLAAKGVHAIDLGHAGMFMKRLHLSPAEALAAGRSEED